MVRIKHRYLLLDILYPDPSTWPQPHPTSTSHSKPKSSTLTKSHSQTQSHQLQIHAPTSDALTPGLLAKMIREEVGEVFGDWGIGRLGGAGGGGVSVKYLSPATSTAIIRCPRASFRLVWSALTYMSHVPDFNPSSNSKSKSNSSAGARTATRPCVFRVIRVSGTMRKAEEEAIRRARREIVRLRGVEEGGVLGLVGIGGVTEGLGSGVVDVDEDVEMGLSDDDDDEEEEEEE